MLYLYKGLRINIYIQQNHIVFTITGENLKDFFKRDGDLQYIDFTDKTWKRLIAWILNATNENKRKEAVKGCNANKKVIVNKD